MLWNNMELPEKNIYFKDDDVIIYCADCREILPLIPDKSIDLVLTDPPYDIHVDGGGMCSRRNFHKAIKKANLDNFSPKDFMPLIWNKCNHGYFWTSKNCLGDFLKWVDDNVLNWDLLIMAKRNPIPAKNNKYLPDSEIILFIRGDSCYWNNNAPYNFYRKVKWVDSHPPEFGHPTEKPVYICEEFIQLSTMENQIVIDPFMGSGTTLVASKNLNRKCIGIEIEEKYCEISAKRCRQGVMMLEENPKQEFRQENLGI